MMETKLERISQLSRENPDMVFTSIGHFLNKEMLKGCHEKMDGDRAVGIDGITKEEYDRNLDEKCGRLSLPVWPKGNALPDIPGKTLGIHPVC